MARYVGISIDAGKTFSQAYLNMSGQVWNETTSTINNATVFNEITGTTQILGPLPDNLSGSDANTDNTFSFGINQGVAVADGVILGAWTGNQDGGASGTELNVILGGKATYTTGPRIVNSTMGPVESGTAVDLTPADLNTPLDFNNTIAADGTPEFTGFVVYFDRPVNIATFTTSAINVFYRNVIASGESPGSAVNVLSVTPVYDETSGLSQNQEENVVVNDDMATKFLIEVAPQSAVGTYSYQIAPAVTDRDEMQLTSASAITLGNLMDQNANGVGGETPGDYYAVPTPTNPASSWTGTYFQPPYTTSSLPIIVYGPTIASTFVPGNPVTSDNLVLNATVSALDIVFDRNMNPATITAASILRVLGPVGSIGPGQAVPATFTITPDPNGTDPDPSHPRTYQINFLNSKGGPLALSTSGTYVVTLASSIQDEFGDALDTNQNAGVDVLRDTPSAGTVPVIYSNATTQAISSTAGSIKSTITVPDSYVLQNDTDITLSLNITYPRDTDLTVTLTAPNGISVELFSGIGGAGNQSNFTNTVFDDAATTPIESGGPPFTGRFNPQFPLSNLFSAGSFNSDGTWTLTITSLGGKTGSLTGWSIQLQKPQSLTGLGESVADQATASFRIFTASNTNAVSSTTWTDIGPEPNNTTTFSNNTTTGIPATPGIVSSTIQVPNALVLQNDTEITLTLNITYPNDPDLTVGLTAPNGNTVELFSAVGAGGSNFTDTVFDDAASLSIDLGTAPFTGRFKPQSPFSGLFTGGPLNASGNWVLTITSSGGQSAR